jgi:hypothetical protein
MPRTRIDRQAPVLERHRDPHRSTCSEVDAFLKALSVVPTGYSRLILEPACPDGICDGTHRGIRRVNAGIRGAPVMTFATERGTAVRLRLNARALQNFKAARPLLDGLV